MPVDRIYASEDSCWGLWKITEDEASLQKEVIGEVVPPTLVNPLKRREFLAGRSLIKALLSKWQFPYHGIEKDRYGKPFLTDKNLHISISHSYPFVAAIIHRQKNVGIDLEQPKDKLLRIAHRILAADELSNAGEDVVKHCVYWCAKETLIKIYGKKDLIFSKNLLIAPFSLQSKGDLIGRIVVNNTETAIPLEYIVSDNFVVVFSN